MRRYHSLALGIAALALTANSPGSRPRNACHLAAGDRSSYQVNVPFTAIDGRIYVEATVNGRGPYIFALDTGASGVGRADSALVAALDLPYGEESATSDGIRESKVRTVRIEALRLGGLSRSNLQVIMRDYRSRLAPEAAFAGILGREFFADGLLIIDYGRKTISFSRK
ncbi:MAG: clan AA aspartic protease, partial [Sphingomonadales bacterium]|nr:clan AA aspartic protease [Sphingomonadales bacterium]